VVLAVERRAGGVARVLSVFDLYRPFQGATPLKTTLVTPRYDQDGTTLPAVAVSAACGRDGATLLALVNLDPHRAARVSTNLTAAASGRLLTATTMDAHNTFEHPGAVAPRPFGGVMVDGRLTFDLPAMSIVAVSVPARNAARLDPVNALARE
jgi:alpha-N-arabinofuranosidase